MDFSEYKRLLNNIKNHNYTFGSFANNNLVNNSVCLLRHDVDFCLRRAYEMSLIEESLNVKSTYYVLVSSDHYNVCSLKNKAYLEGIAKNHNIGLHFDASETSDVLNRFKKETMVLENLIDQSISSFSFHRPGTHGFPFNAVEEISSTYDPQYFQKGKYVSDSAGNVERVWNSLDTILPLSSSFQLLIHPIWWTGGRVSPQLLAKSFAFDYMLDVNKSFSDNCKVFNVWE